MTANTSRRERRFAIVTLAKHLKSIKEAAKEFGCHPRTVSRLLQKYEKTGDLGDMPRSGRPRKLAGEQAKRALKRGTKAKMSCKDLVGHVQKELGVAVCSETVRRSLKQQDLARPLRAQRKPHLTPKQMDARLRFCKKWIRPTWKNIVITDSKYFWLHPQGVGSKCWVWRGDTPPARCAFKNNTHKVHVYAGVSCFGRTPLFVTVGTTGLKSIDASGKKRKGVTGEVYRELLQQSFIPACQKIMQGTPYQDSWIFQQDGATAHTAKETKTLLQSMGVQTMEWPSNSPDLSWIESMWSIMSRRLEKRQDLTAANFQAAIQEEWESIPNTAFQAQFRSIKNRLRACIATQGGSTDY